MNAKLLPGRLEGSIANVVGSEEFAPVAGRRRFAGCHVGEVPFVANRIGLGVAQPFLAPHGFPDVPAVQLRDQGEHCQLMELGRETQPATQVG